MIPVVLFFLLAGRTVAGGGSLSARATPPGLASSPKQQLFTFRKAAVVGAASLSTFTAAGVLTGHDHIIRSDRPKNTYRLSKAVWALVRLSNPATCLWLAFSNQLCSPRRKLLLAMATVSGLRHAFWGLKLCRKPWPLLPLSLPVACLNNIFDWLHCRSAVEREEAAGEEQLGLVAYIGVISFVVGSYLETASEWQRHNFIQQKKNLKAKEESEGTGEVKDSTSTSTSTSNSGGKLCTTGLWAKAAHINYLGYVLWRLGIGLVSAPPYTAAFGVVHLVDFQLRAVPMLRRHLQCRYGQEWTDYAKRTSVLIPGVI